MYTLKPTSALSRYPHQLQELIGGVGMLQASTPRVRGLLLFPEVGSCVPQACGPLAGGGGGAGALSHSAINVTGGALPQLQVDLHKAPPFLASGGQTGMNIKLKDVGSGTVTLPSPGGHVFSPDTPQLRKSSVE